MFGMSLLMAVAKIWYLQPSVCRRNQATFCLCGLCTFHAICKSVRSKTWVSGQLALESFRQSRGSPKTTAFAVLGGALIVEPQPRARKCAWTRSQHSKGSFRILSRILESHQKVWENGSGSRKERCLKRMEGESTLGTMARLYEPAHGSPGTYRPGHWRSGCRLFGQSP